MPPLLMQATFFVEDEQAISVCTRLQYSISTFFSKHFSKFSATHAKKNTPANRGK